MIKDLIVRLMEEANEESEHKGWCDTELSTNEQTRKEKTEAVETLHAEIDQLESSIAKLTEDVTELTKAVAELDAAMASATTLRQEEKATNTVTVKDSRDAQTAVAQALTVLKEFYAKAGEATALLQQRQQPTAPATFDAPYKRMGGETDYDALHKDYSESIDALERATTVLKKQAHDRSQTSLVQVSALTDSELMPKYAKAVITAFLEQDQPAEGLEVNAPDAKGYEFQSQGLLKCS